MANNSENTKFNPNEITFKDGLKRIDRGLAKAGVRLDKGILTSRDKNVRKAMKLLQVDNVPNGFLKWQLPVHLDKPSQLFISTSAPRTSVPEHSHEDGDGIRFIVAGSIHYNDVELGAGDWMFIPAGTKYKFEVGDLGATMCYCYCCCCSGARLFGEDVSNPNPV